MNQEIFNRICFVIDTLNIQGKKLTLSNVVTQSLFSVGGTLAGLDKEALQVIKMYVKKVNEFEYTYKHNSNVETFTLSLNPHGCMALGYKLKDGKRFYQHAMERHIEQQLQLLSVLAKVETSELMLNTFIPNNIQYCKKGLEKISA